jgi:hypothetical protein
MKRTLLFVAVFTFAVLGLWSCSHDVSSPTPTSPNNPPVPTPTVSSGPQTISVSTASSGASATGYIYTVNGTANGTGGLLSLTAHVGDAIVLPGSSFHPLYFDGGSTTCIYMAATSTETYTFPSAGTYYFHCGNHGSGCSNGDGACGSTNCTSMAGIVTVN